jgi:hypothetical protein
MIGAADLARSLGSAVSLDLPVRRASMLERLSVGIDIGGTKVGRGRRRRDRPGARPPAS